MTDGKYLSLATLKQYLIGTVGVTSGNTTVFNQGVVGTPDDAMLSDCILQAEADFDMACGSGFDQQTYNNVQGMIPFVDGNGYLHIYARERGPVTAVTSVQYRDIMFGSSTQWNTITWNTPDDIILPSFAATDTYPRPESWHVQIWPSSSGSGNSQGAIPPRAVGQILVRWTYTGGFQTIPLSLQTMIARMATHVYKLREMPAGKVVNQPLGTITIPANYPPDLLNAIAKWSPVYA